MLLQFIVLMGYLVKSTVILLVATLLCQLLRRSSAATRHLVWSAALGGVLLLPIFAMELAAWNVVSELRDGDSANPGPQKSGQWTAETPQRTSPSSATSNAQSMPAVTGVDRSVVGATLRSIAPPDRARTTEAVPVAW